MQNIKKHFDEFTFNTWIMPVGIACTPFLVIAIYIGLVSLDWIEASINFSLGIFLLTFGGYIARQWGKNYEQKMFQELGGMPTTIILRFSDKTIDNVTKLKYHKLLNNIIPDVELPLSLQEEQEDQISDEKYTSVMRFLRVNANSNRDKYPRVYQELKKYNFWRNLYGCRIIFSLSYLAFLARECVVINNFSFKEMVITPYPKYVVFFVLAGWIIIFLMVVTKKTVKSNAFDYAKTLLETLENISNDKNT